MSRGFLEMSIRKTPEEVSSTYYTITVKYTFGTQSFYIDQEDLPKLKKLVDEVSAHGLPPGEAFAETA